MLTTNSLQSALRSLENTSLPTIVQALTQSFANYFVPLPTSVEYWQDRYHAARVDYTLSFGLFEEEALIAFIINGIDDFQGHKTAFNTGTGVLPSHRGQAAVDRIYAHAIPLLRKVGIQKLALEVITQNERAIRVYQRIGFKITRLLHCYKGEVQPLEPGLRPVSIDIEEVLNLPLPGREFDSWDNTDNAIRKGSKIYQAYRATKGEKTIGYVVLNPKTGHIHRAETTNNNWPQLLDTIAQVTPVIRMNNIDSRRTDVHQGLKTYGLPHVIDQYEMECTLSAED
jgi:ribosomal protein S18 acetylase RimI-like enzyme